MYEWHWCIRCTSIILYYFDMTIVCACVCVRCVLGVLYAFGGFVFYFISSAINVTLALYGCIWRSLFPSDASYVFAYLFLVALEPLPNQQIYSLAKQLFTFAVQLKWIHHICVGHDEHTKTNDNNFKMCIHKRHECKKL